jgi:hypothetical protein
MRVRAAARVTAGPRSAARVPRRRRPAPAARTWRIGVAERSRVYPPSEEPRVARRSWIRAASKKCPTRADSRAIKTLLGHLLVGQHTLGVVACGAIRRTSPGHAAKQAITGSLVHQPTRDPCKEHRITARRAGRLNDTIVSALRNASARGPCRLGRVGSRSRITHTTSDPNRTCAPGSPCGSRVASPRIAGMHDNGPLPQLGQVGGQYCLARRCLQPGRDNSARGRRGERAGVREDHAPAVRLSGHRSGHRRKRP